MRAIIIDDEKHVREGLLLLGEWTSFGIDTIFEASNGEEAIKIITESRPEIIFTDMKMPKMDGINLLKWLNESSIQSKIIVLSGYDDYHYMRNAIQYGSFDYLLKPIDPEMLNETLERAVIDWKIQAENKILRFEDDLEVYDGISDEEYRKEKTSIQQIEEYLQQNYKEDIKLQGIADKFFLSREYICRKFKQEYQITITEYLTKVRMEKAQMLLQNSHYKIYEIADLTGYQNDKYFCKVFKRWTGLTPNEYRDSIKPLSRVNG
ncbi:response regulator [Bacillus sp. 03113]|uniref:response regulator transcription factor n=1 Tax=Bacillus sp. 03113 TaxID=2578211 RepID=UPI00114380C0|nr:response regulator [Bacillus sp. 03113]